MTKDVTIKIKGKQRYPEGEKLETVTEVAAEYYLRRDSHYVMYEETEAGFSVSSKCMLKMRKQYVELTKKGLVQSHMIFEEGKLHVTDYRTPFGVVVLGVRTKRIYMSAGEDSMTVQIEYSLEADEQHMADCDIRIEVKNRN